MKYSFFVDEEGFKGILHDRHTVSQSTSVIDEEGYYLDVFVERINPQNTDQTRTWQFLAEITYE